MVLSWEVLAKMRLRKQQHSRRGDNGDTNSLHFVVVLIGVRTDALLISTGSGGLGHLCLCS